MKNRGIIYQAPSYLKRVLFYVLRSFGAGLISFALVGLIFTFWPIIKQEYLYNFGTKEQIQISKFGELIGKSMAKEPGLDPYFSIFIPKINAKAKVIPNVDPGKPANYLNALTQGVAHAQGTYFPGQGKTIYLFSHSTDSPINIARYNAVFYLLGKLEKGDRIIVYFLGVEHEYIVTDKFVTSANDTSWLNPPSQGFGEAMGERLILQTCDPPGTSWNRLLVIARPI